jgi:hypothetical protein
MCSKLRARKKRETESREKTDSYNQKQAPVNTKPSIIWGYHQVVVGISLIETGSGNSRESNNFGNTPWWWPDHGAQIEFPQ